MIIFIKKGANVYRIVEAVNGTQIITDGIPYIGTGWGPGHTITWKKVNLPDSRFNISAYKDDVYQDSIISNYAATDYPNVNYFNVLCRDSSEGIQWDNLVISVVSSTPEEPVVDTSFGSRRRRSKASRTAVIEAPVELEPVTEPSTGGLSDTQKLAIVALGGVVAYSIFTAKPKPKTKRRRRR